MPKVSVQIPDNLLDQHSKDAIKELEKQVKNRDKKIKRLEDKVSDLESDAEASQKIIKSTLNFLDDIRWEKHVDKFLDNGGWA